MVHMVNEHGFSAVKLKIAERFGYDQDVARGRTKNVIREVRSALGDDVDILVDANSGYTAHGAIRAGRMMEKYGVFHFEEPCPYWDLDANASVSAALDMPVAGGEQDWNLHTFRDMLASDVYDIIQFDVVKCGGLLRGKKISSMAGAFGKVVTPHCVSWTLGLIANLHFAVSTPELRYAQEYAVDELPTKGLLANYDVTVKDGRLPVPEGPGLGVELNWNCVKKVADRIL
jgi:L-alanine-DL-glutamate epimerase-like enolase superfamily enzyme